MARQAVVQLASLTGWALAELLELDGLALKQWLEAARAVQPKHAGL